MFEKKELILHFKSNAAGKQATIGILIRRVRFYGDVSLLDPVCSVSNSGY